MVCTTAKNGRECPFMTAKGCSYNGGTCHEIVDQCKGCSKSIETSSGWYCASYPEPSLKWKNGNCNFATHIAAAAEAKAKVNPLKASKRGNKR